MFGCQFCGKRDLKKNELPMTYILVTSADSKREMLEKNDGGREVELKEYLDNLEQVRIVDVNHQPICTYNEPQIGFSLCIF